ncbi:MAG: glycerophosphodiester phosphodiesterase family protein, partial [Anaerolineae bacterium]|nr:glycerophosphodiester phosphodiesterase family protein [Anaerolineae bacterium]
MPHILNIAHRGARSLAPENTLAAARKALEAGADMWELDVSMTADGEPILMHDPFLERTCNAQERFPARRPWLVSEFTLAEVQTLDCGSWFNERDPFGQIRAGAVPEKDQRSYVGQRVPTLREALEFTHDHNWQVSVEIKDISHQLGDTAIVEKVVALIEKLDMVDRVLIFSFNPGYLR